MSTGKGALWDLQGHSLLLSSLPMLSSMIDPDTLPVQCLWEPSGEPPMAPPRLRSTGLGSMMVVRDGWGEGV